MNKIDFTKPSKRKPYKKYKTQDLGCENYLQQEFNPKSPNIVWCSDFTYTKVNNMLCYLCAVMDMFSRKIVEWHISNRHDANLVMESFSKKRN